MQRVCERNPLTHISVAAYEAMGDPAIVDSFVHLPHPHFSLCSGKTGRGDISYKPLGQQDIVRT